LAFSSVTFILRAIRSHEGGQLSFVLGGTRSIERDIVARFRLNRLWTDNFGSVVVSGNG
jgi:hypothetical protein